MTIDRDAFVRGYVLTAIWSSSIGDDFAAAHNTRTGEDWSGDQSMLDFGFEIDNVSDEAMSTIREECAAFVAHNAPDLEAYCEQVGVWHGSDSVRGADARYSEAEQAGGDFWLSRNGHGAGYSDRGREPFFTRLQDAARLEGDSTLYVGDDERIYVA
jgi:hypothetical protein